MTIEQNTFAEACFNQNSIEELRDALTRGVDEYDCIAWGIGPQEWREQISLALNGKLRAGH